MIATMSLAFGRVAVSGDFMALGPMGRSPNWPHLVVEFALDDASRVEVGRIRRIDTGQPFEPGAHYLPAIRAACVNEAHRCGKHDAA